MSTRQRTLIEDDRRTQIWELDRAYVVLTKWNGKFTVPFGDDKDYALRWARSLALYERLVRSISQVRFGDTAE